MSKVKSQLKIGVILNYLNIGLGNLIPILYTPIMLNILGQSEYGLYKLSSSITSYLSLISMGIGASVTRYLIKSREEEGKEAEERVLGLFFVIFQVIAVVSFIVGVVLTTLLHLFYGDSMSVDEMAKMRILVFLMVCNTALTFSVSPFVTVVTAHEKFLFNQLMNIATTCIVPIVNIIVLFCGFTSVGMATTSLIISFVVNISYLIYVRVSMNMKPRIKDMPINLLKEILVFSFWIFIANIVNQLYNATDTVMIGMAPSLGTEAIAIYNVGSVFNQIVFSLAASLSTILSPRTQKIVFSGASNSELTDMCIKVGRLQAYIVSLTITGFIAFGQPFMYYYAGADYGDSYWVAVFMMVPHMIPMVQSICLSIIVALNKHKFRSLVYLGIAVLNVIGTWFLMRTRLGVIGAALMTGVALIIGQGFVMNWYYSKKTGLEIGRFWGEILKVFVAPIIMCIIVLVLSTIIDLYNIPVLITSIIVYTIIFVLINWFMVMNSYEKGFLLNPINRLFKKYKKINK